MIVVIVSVRRLLLLLPLLPPLLRARQGRGKPAHDSARETSTLLHEQGSASCSVNERLVFLPPRQGRRAGELLRLAGAQASRCGWSVLLRKMAGERRLACR